MTIKVISSNRLHIITMFITNLTPTISSNLSLVST